MPAVPKDEGGRGFLDASTDPAQLAAWAQRWPNANVGLPVPDGFTVVDCDVQHDGHVSVAALAAAGNTLPETYRVRTGGGGWHAWLRVPEGMQLPGKLAPGVDVRQYGGYVIAPGGRHPNGRLYEVESLAPIAPAPAWIQRQLVPRGAPRVTDRTAPGEDPRLAKLEWGMRAERALSDVERAAIDAAVRAVEPIAIPGQRYTVLNKMGGVLGRRGWSQESVESFARAFVERYGGDDIEHGVRGCLAGISYPSGYHELEKLAGDYRTFVTTSIDALPNPYGAELTRARQRANAALAPALAANTPANASTSEVYATLPSGAVVRIDDIDDGSDDFEPANDTTIEPAADRPLTDAEIAAKRSADHRKAHLLTAAQLADFEPKHKPLCAALGLGVGPAAVCSSPSGLGKSWLMNTVMAQVEAHEAKLFGRFDVQYPSDAAGVVLVSLEMGIAEVARRTKETYAAHGYNLRTANLETWNRPNFKFVERRRYEDAPADNFRHGDGNRALYGELVSALSGKVLAVFDTLRAFSEGDESNSSFRAAQDMLTDVSEATGCAIIVLHHAGKDGKMRGSSAIFDAAETVLELSRNEAGDVILTQSKRRSQEGLAKPMKVNIGPKCTLEDLSDDDLQIGESDAERVLRYANKIPDYFVSGVNSATLAQLCSFLKAEIENQANVKKACAMLCDTGKLYTDQKKSKGGLTYGRGTNAAPTADAAPAAVLTQSVMQPAARDNSPPRKPALTEDGYLQPPAPVQSAASAPTPAAPAPATEPVAVEPPPEYIAAVAAAESRLRNCAADTDAAVAAYVMWHGLMVPLRGASQSAPGDDAFLLSDLMARTGLPETERRAIGLALRKHGYHGVRFRAPGASNAERDRRYSKKGGN